MKTWIKLDAVYVRLDDVSAFEERNLVLLVHLRSGVTVRAHRDFQHELREAFGIARAERAEHGVYE